MAVPVLGHLPAIAEATASNAFTFVLLGDLHLDKLEHHDFEWLRREKPEDVRQVENYSKITREIMPRLFATVRETIAAANQRSASHIPFVIQVGDFVEGLCGNDILARQHKQDAIRLVRDSQFGVPFLFTKGNHDVTGPGAGEAYKDIFYPFLSEQSAPLKSGGKVTSGSYSIEHQDALFCFFDAYDQSSVDWLEAALSKRTSRHCFVVIHPPVVPYGARAAWYLYSKAKDASRRGKLLELLGKHNAFILGGHIHKYNVLARTTRGRGRFLQLAISSIISAPQVKVKHVLNGAKDYNGDQIHVEPAFSPSTEAERRAVYDREKPFVREFQYADVSGYAMLTIEGDRVTGRVFSGFGTDVWRELDLTKLLRA